MDLVECRKVHGYISSNDDSESEFSSFDENYEKLKIPPVPFDELKKKLVYKKQDELLETTEFFNSEYKAYSNVKQSSDLIKEQYVEDGTKNEYSKSENMFSNIKQKNIIMQKAHLDEKQSQNVNNFAHSKPKPVSPKINVLHSNKFAQNAHLNHNTTTLCNASLNKKYNFIRLDIIKKLPAKSIIRAQIIQHLLLKNNKNADQDKNECSAFLAQNKYKSSINNEDCSVTLRKKTHLQQCEKKILSETSHKVHTKRNKRYLSCTII